MKNFLKFCKLSTTLKKYALQQKSELFDNWKYYSHLRGRLTKEPIHINLNLTLCFYLTLCIVLNFLLFSDIVVIF